jgi:hypothetical protein
MGEMPMGDVAAPRDPAPQPVPQPRTAPHELGRVRVEDLRHELTR